MKWPGDHQIFHISQTKTCPMKKYLLRVSCVKNFTTAYCLLMLILALPVATIAQVTSRTVSGVVTDNKKNPLQKVSITIKGTSKGTTTDADGRFALKDVAANRVLVFSSTGFASQEIPVSGKNTVDVTMTEAASALNEVVVVGYGTRQKKDVTGAVAQVKATQLENENPPSVQDLLRGNIPGLNISQTNTASAKGGGDLQVRGRSSIKGGTSPLIVLDGVIYFG